ncbi:claudin i [Aplochiton taeniatus]
MGSTGMHILCVVLGIFGLVGTILCCAIPRWKVSSFTGSNIVTAQSDQEGLWTSCVVQSTGQEQCKKYDSLLAQSAELKAAQALVVISCMVSSLSLLILLAGSNFTTCIENEDSKPKICLVAGIGMLLASLLIIIPVSWYAHNVIRNFNDPLIPQPQKKELGACIFVGWVAGVLLLLAGGLLCCFSKAKASSAGGTAKYYSNSASAPSSKNYV